MPKNCNTAIFDLDGTLLNTGVTFHEIVNELKTELGESSVDFESVRKFSSRGATLILKNCFPDYSDSSIKELKASFLKKYEHRLTDNLKLYDGVEEMITTFSDYDVPWGIVTNKSWKYTGPIIKELGWDKRTNAIVCPDHVSETKPHPEGILLAISKLNSSISNSFYIGDHRRDIETGINAGVKTIACTWGYSEDDPNNWNADYVASEVSEIKQWIL